MNYDAFKQGKKTYYFIHIFLKDLYVHRVCEIESVVATNSMFVTISLFFRDILQYVHETAINASPVFTNRTTFLEHNRANRQMIEREIDGARKTKSVYRLMENAMFNAHKKTRNTEYNAMALKESVKKKNPK